MSAGIATCQRRRLVNHHSAGKPDSSRKLGKCIFKFMDVVWFGFSLLLRSTRLIDNLFGNTHTIHHVSQIMRRKFCDAQVFATFQHQMDSRNARARGFFFMIPVPGGREQRAQFVVWFSGGDGLPVDDDHAVPVRAFLHSLDSFFMMPNGTHAASIKCDDIRYPRRHNDWSKLPSTVLSKCVGVSLWSD